MLNNMQSFNMNSDSFSINPQYELLSHTNSEDMVNNLAGKLGQIAKESFLLDHTYSSSLTKSTSSSTSLLPNTNKIPKVNEDIKTSALSTSSSSPLIIENTSTKSIQKDPILLENDFGYRQDLKKLEILEKERKKLKIEEDKDRISNAQDVKEAKSTRLLIVEKLITEQKVNIQKKYNLHQDNVPTSLDSNELTLKDNQGQKNTKSYSSPSSSLQHRLINNEIHTLSPPLFLNPTSDVNMSLGEQQMPQSPRFSMSNTNTLALNEDIKDIKHANSILDGYNKYIAKNIQELMQITKSAPYLPNEAALLSSPSLTNLKYDNIIKPTNHNMEYHCQQNHDNMRRNSLDLDIVNGKNHYFRSSITDYYHDASSSLHEYNSPVKHAAGSRNGNDNNLVIISPKKKNNNINPRVKEVSFDQNEQEEDFNSDHYTASFANVSQTISEYMSKNNQSASNNRGSVGANVIKPCITQFDSPLNQFIKRKSGVNSSIKEENYMENSPTTTNNTSTTGIRESKSHNLNIFDSPNKVKKQQFENFSLPLNYKNEELEEQLVRIIDRLKHYEELLNDSHERNMKTELKLQQYECIIEQLKINNMNEIKNLYQRNQKLQEELSNLKLKYKLEYDLYKKKADEISLAKEPNTNEGTSNKSTITEYKKHKQCPSLSNFTFNRGSINNFRNDIRINGNSQYHDCKMIILTPKMITRSITPTSGNQGFKR